MGGVLSGRKEWVKVCFLHLIYWDPMSHLPLPLNPPLRILNYFLPPQGGKPETPPFFSKKKCVCGGPHTCA